MLTGLLFVGFGSILPAPLGPISTQARTSLNRWVIGLFPSSAPRLRPNERTERQLEQTENP
ncbi:MAG: hypothetical protein HC824_16770 [Synechococcales cyanobacterium RM1_1_8]|nr:hypothetical protein [Synechococcales cyanobacterium RM1_1_8]